MLFWILIIVVLAITVWTGIATGWGGDAVGAFFASLVVGGFILAMGGLAVNKTTDVSHSDISNQTYTLASGSSFKVDANGVEFIYKDDKGDLKQYDEYAKNVIISSSNARTVQITKTRYDIGTGIYPWGQDRVDTTAVVK